uniref:Uncharacterized protein n=1 Tax=Anguilla anguilla TaxID=7936 RepID=A0A0E9XBR0_ANGAN
MQPLEGELGVPEGSGT